MGVAISRAEVEGRCSGLNQFFKRTLKSGGTSGRYEDNLEKMDDILAVVIVWSDEEYCVLIYAGRVV